MVGVMMMVLNSLGNERMCLGTIRVIAVDGDIVELPVIFSRHPARSNSPVWTFVMTVFEDFVEFIVVVVAVVETEDEFVISCDSRITVQHGFVWRSASHPQVPCVLCLFVRQIVQEYLSLLGPQVVSQVALVFSVLSVIDLGSLDSVFVRVFLLRELFALVIPGAIIVDELLVVSSILESIIEGLNVSSFVFLQFLILRGRRCQSIGCLHGLPSVP